MEGNNVLLGTILTTNSNAMEKNFFKKLIPVLLEKLPPFMLPEGYYSFHMILPLDPFLSLMNYIKCEVFMAENI